MDVVCLLFRSFFGPSRTSAQLKRRAPWHVSVRHFFCFWSWWWGGRAEILNIEREVCEWGDAATGQRLLAGVASQMEHNVDLVPSR